jgi:hypothetical protein
VIDTGTSSMLSQGTLGLDRDLQRSQPGVKVSTQLSTVQSTITAQGLQLAASRHPGGFRNDQHHVDGPAPCGLRRHAYARRGGCRIDPVRRTRGQRFTQHHGCQIENISPENITVGSSVPGAGDIELRVNTANVPSLKQIILALEKFELFTNNQNYGPSNFKVL